MLKKEEDAIFTWPLWGLMALMAATRFHHFGDLRTLPDASLAVFFLAGLFVANPWAFVILLIEAGLIDYLAIHFGGVSGWCVTPAYLFLIPTYGILWLGGRRSRGFSPDTVTGIVSTLGAVLVAAMLAFLLSNAGFYLLSGYFDGLGPVEYSTRVVSYLPPYLMSTFTYSALVLAGLWLWRHLSAPGPALPHK